ncbi:GNAT family N-acetyltransferase [Cytobacillus sp. FSL R7-0696]|uniref:GNAT family N-acetyltransferase n=1 Tax=Cytobacillus sp. FSL R7-0696 TaxID=2921691 RepID=UPI0030FCCF84
MEIRAYRPEDEIGWVRCRVLAFLDSAYYDNVLTAKEHYENQAIELIAITDQTVVGLIDVEYENEERSVCFQGSGLGGMIWHIAVHPDYRRQGIARALLTEAERIARKKNIHRLEAWTRDDNGVNSWYQQNGFTSDYSYLHLYINEEEGSDVIYSKDKNILPTTTFAHYVGDNKEEVKSQYKRAYECFCYEKFL